MAAFIRIVQPRKGDGYAERVPEAMAREAHRVHLPITVVATTAYIESEFRMDSGPCVGIMQVNTRTSRELFHQGEREARELDGNIRLGAMELAHHYRTATRKSPGSALRGMWGRYNGCGPSGGYVRRALRVLHHLKEGDVDSWSKRIKKGPLWQS